jgi:hypothetical protein
MIRHLLGRYNAQTGALLGISAAFAFVRHTQVPLWLAIPIGIFLVYVTVFLVGLLIGYARR